MGDVVALRGLDILDTPLLGIKCRHLEPWRL